MARPAQRAMTCLLLAAILFAGGASSASAEPDESPPFFFPAKVRQPPPKQVASSLFVDLEARPTGYFMDYAGDLPRFVDHSKKEIGFWEIERTIRESILRKIPRRDREFADIHVSVRDDLDRLTGAYSLVFATKFKIWTLRQVKLDLRSIHPGFAPGTIALGIPVRHSSDYRVRFRFHEYPSEGEEIEPDDLDLLMQVDGMSLDASLSLPEEGDDREVWTKWVPMRLGRLQGFGRIASLEIHAATQTALDDRREVIDSAMSDDLWEISRSATLSGTIEFCVDRKCRPENRLTLRIDHGESSDSTSSDYTIEKGRLVLPLLPLAKGFILLDANVHPDIENHRGEGGDSRPHILYVKSLGGVLRTANGPRFRILPHPVERWESSIAVEGLYAPDFDSLDLTLDRLEFDIGNNRIAQARQVRVRHSPRMRKRQPWIAVDTLWVRRRGAGEEVTIPVVANPRGGNAHLLAISASGTELDRATICKAVGAECMARRRTHRRSE